MSISQLYNQVNILLQEINDECLNSKLKLNQSNDQIDYKKYNILVIKLKKIKEIVETIKLQVSSIDDNTNNLTDVEYETIKKLLQVPLSIPELCLTLSKLAVISDNIKPDLTIVDNIEETIVYENVIE